MRVFSYKRLFKKLIDLDMTSNELMEKAKVSKSTFYKMKNGQNITTDVLLRICNALDCDIEEIVECKEKIKSLCLRTLLIHKILYKFISIYQLFRRNY